MITKNIYVQISYKKRFADILLQGQQEHPHQKFPVIDFRIGAWYVYDEMTNTFKYREGEQLLPILENIGDNLPSIHRQLLVEYPQEVSLVEGNHPEVFTANGSHGTWGAEGEWGLVQFLFVDVFDDCERGSALRAWLNPIYVDRNVDEAEFNGTDLQWVNFRGKFGNIQKLVRAYYVYYRVDFFLHSVRIAYFFFLGLPHFLHHRQVRPGGRRHPAWTAHRAGRRVRGL